MKIISLDCETTTHSKGNPYDSRNRLCLVGTWDGSDYNVYNIEYDDAPYGHDIEILKSDLNTADLILLFNAKFDLNWLRNYGVNYDNFKIWDCQLAHFILGNQTQPYPSLDGVAEHYGFGTKLDTIKSYWEAGLQTNEIPIDELTDYLQRDLKLTYEVYLKQKREIETAKSHLAKLINVSMVDTLVLADMEFNGILFNKELSMKLGDEAAIEIGKIKIELQDLINA